MELNQSISINFFKAMFGSLKIWREMQMKENREEKYKKRKNEEK